jgi:hypothetical protein
MPSALLGGMKTKILSAPIFSSLSSFAAAVVLSMTLGSASADIPQSSSSEFRGMYKVAASNDPIFPMQANQEWFLDFGSGITQGKMSGSVAVSLRQNPHVKVRIMAWQYFPKQGVLVIGNPYSEGSKQAVAKGSWQMTATSSGGVSWDRGTYQVVLHRAERNDY